MELLIIKNKQTYFRFKDNKYIEVKLDKASVFPLEQMEKVQEHLAKIKQQGFPRACIKKLVLTEEDL